MFSPTQIKLHALNEVAVGAFKFMSKTADVTTLHTYPNSEIKIVNYEKTH